MIPWWSEEVGFIRPFGLDHLIFISVVLVLLVALILNRDYAKRNAKRIRLVVLAVSIFQQILLYTWYTLEMGFDLSESLPFQICRLSSLLGIYFLITKDKRALDLVFFFGLYAYGSFLYPARIYPVFHAMGLSFFLNHAITLLLPYFGYIAYDWRPSFRGTMKAYLWFLAYFAFVYFLNPLVDGNYFYLKYRPFFGGWPDYVYVPFVLAFTFGIFVLAYKVVQSISAPHGFHSRSGHRAVRQ